jgi:hypothetical protein
MNDSTRKMLTLKIGECWHVKSAENIYRCAICGQIGDLTHRTFDNWQDFGSLWKWAKSQEWWYRFMAWFGVGNLHASVYVAIDNLIDPTLFPALISAFGRERLGWKEEL